MKTIFLFIGKEIYGLDLLRGEFIEYLTKEYRVVAFVNKKILVDNEKIFFRSPNLVYVSWSVQNPWLWDRFKTFRAMFIRQFDQLVVQRYKRLRMEGGWKRKIFLAVLDRLSWLFTVDLVFWMERFLMRPKYRREFQRYCDEYHPVAVITATPGMSNLDAEAIALGRSAGLPTAAINASWDNLTTKARVFRRPDYFIVWNNVIKKELLRLYSHSEDKIFVSGRLRLDKFLRKSEKLISREEFFKQKKLDPNKKTIFFSTTSASVYPYHVEVLKDLLRFRKEKKFISDPNIFIRVHYRDFYDAYKEFLNEPNLYVEDYLPTSADKDIANLKASFVYSDVNLNYTSTLSIDAAALDKPVVNIAWPDDAKVKHYTYNHYKPLIDMGAVRLAYSPEEMLAYINMYFEHPEIDRDNRKRLAEEYIGLVDGYSYQRMIDFIGRIVDSK